MRYTIQKTDPNPAYLQLYKQLRDDITQGIYPFNSKLPSKRSLADVSGVSTITVEHAYGLLCDEGYIEARLRSGYYVIFRACDGFTEPTKADHAEVNTAPRSTSADPQKFPISVLTKTMRKVLSVYGEAILEKSPNAGAFELREALRLYLARSRGIHADLDQIIVGSGAEYLYGLLVGLLGRNRVYAIESPSYEKIQQVYAAFDIQYIMLPLGQNGIESSALWSADADVLHITPYRSFPSGVTASASKRHEYLQWAQRGRYIIEDDFESEFSISRKPEETLFTHTAADNVIYINTFSKTISPALRVGYMVLPKHLVSQFEDRLGFYSCTVPTFEQLVLAGLIRNGDFERQIHRVRRKLRKQPFPP